jgi:hypothetical protein
VICHPDRGHLQALRLGKHRRDLRGTVQHRVFGVVVEVHEGGPMSARAKSRRTGHRDASL